LSYELENSAQRNVIRVMHISSAFQFFGHLQCAELSRSSSLSTRRLSFLTNATWVISAGHGVIKDNEANFIRAGVRGQLLGN